MKHLKHLFTALLLMCATVATSQTFEVDGINYRITDETAKSVEVASNTNYSGDVIIPSTVNYNDVTYSVTSIETKAFWGCTGLTSITIPNSVRSIGYEAFWGCSGLTSVVVDEGNSAYDSRDNCNAIIETATNDLILGCKNTVIPNSVTRIYISAFSGCTGLTSITIPNSVESIGSQAFYNCTGLKEVHINDIAAWCGVGFADIHSNPLSYAHNLYLNGELVTEVVIPDGIKIISYYAFSGCTSLTTITIPNSVTRIRDGAFYECTGLTSVEIPNSVTSIGYEAFRSCTGLTSITIGNRVTSIVDEAFSGCTGLTSIEIPNSVTSIGRYAFSDCTGLTSVTIGNSVRSIGDGAFSRCDGLKEVHISDLAAWCGIDFEDNPLYYAHNLYLNGELVTELVIPDGVNEIKQYAFWGCTGLRSVTIPNSVTSIGNGAFRGCTSLTSVEIPNSVTSIGGGAFSGCSGLTSITIPNSVISIGYDAFYGCSALTSVEIPNSVRSIGDGAFEGCSSLTSITIPNRVRSIGYAAFSGCTGLTSITSLIPAERLFACDSEQFNGIDKANCTLYVPHGAKETYAATAGWNEFVNIVELESADIDGIKEQIVESKTVYDLCGRKVDNPTNGIYIINGNKVFVK